MASRSGPNALIRPAAVFGLVLLTALLVPLFDAAAAGAQATPAASPGAAACSAPALLPGTPSASQGAPAASPSTAMTPAAGTPSAAPAAPTFVPTPGPAGTAAAAATAGDVAAAAQNIFACDDAGNLRATAALVTPAFTVSLVGTTNPYDLVAALQGQAPFVLQTLGDVQRHTDGRVSVDVVYLQGDGAHQYAHERWYFVLQGGRLLLDAQEVLNPTPPGDTVTVGVTMKDFAFEPQLDTFADAPAIILHGVNAGRYAHQIVVARFTAGTDVKKVDFSRPLPKGTQLLAERTYQPGEEGDLALVNLEPGMYTLLCFLDAPDGVPHVMKGMVTQLTIEGPAAATPAA